MGRGAVIQRLPSNNNDPTNQANGLYIDRKEMTQIGGKSVPERITGIVKKPAAGSVPSVSPPGWDWLQQRVQRLKGSWVRFHIINRLLGGRGDKTWNLVPTSVAVNNDFSRTIEEAAKANAKKEWTYIDVKLHYNPNWPAPIPERIEAEWGRWSGSSAKWVMKDSKSLDNEDITQIGNKITYVRGVNITLDQLKSTKRKVPASFANDFKAFLRDKRYTSDSETELFKAAKLRFGTEEYEGWLDQIWLDEAEKPGRYQAVVKKFPTTGGGKKRKHNSSGNTGGTRKKRKKTQ